METQMEPPRPKYDKCNAGHTLELIWFEELNAYRWDCRVCINKMEDENNTH